MAYQLGEVIMERIFECRDVNGTLSQVRLLMGKPQIDSEKTKPSGVEIWYCPHQIVGIGAEKIEALRSDDAIAAFLASLQMAGAILTYYARVYRQHITWLGEEELGLAMTSISEEPLPDDQYFERFFQDKM
jgi:hypothetical protein